MNKTLIISCPWHHEITPSCAVDWKSGHVHCFGCHHSATFDELLDECKKPQNEKQLIAIAEAMIQDVSKEQDSVH